MKIVLLAVAVFLASASMLFAHSFKVDKYGCHNNGTLNAYECHSGPLAGKSWPNPGGQVKMLLELNAPPPPPPPPPPPGPVVPDPPIVTTVDKAELTWQPNKPEDNVLGYTLYWSVDGTVWQKPIKLGNRTTAGVTNILKGATYYFYITAYNEHGESLPSNIVSKEVN